MSFTPFPTCFQGEAALDFPTPVTMSMISVKPCFPLQVLHTPGPSRLATANFSFRQDASPLVQMLLMHNSSFQEFALYYKVCSSLRRVCLLIYFVGMLSPCKWPFGATVKLLLPILEYLVGGLAPPLLTKPPVHMHPEKQRTTQALGTLSPMWKTCVVF